MSSEKKDYLSEGALVASYNKRKSDSVYDIYESNSKRLDSSIESSEDIIRRYHGRLLPVLESEPALSSGSRPSTTLPKSWTELLAEAQAVVPFGLEPEALLSKSEIELVLARHDNIGSELGWVGSIDRYDVALSVGAGLLSGILDIFLVKVPAHPGFLGSSASEGGWLSNKVKEIFGDVLSEDRVKKLERLYKVSFDPSVNSALSISVAGLGPRTHRYQSPGHDPILGFIFGVKDLLFGEFTAIDKFGKIIVQATASPFKEGEDFFVRFFGALQCVAGHLASDVATKSGLPAPLMPLLSFLQIGNIKGYSVAEIGRLMYRSGYDFRHFSASSIPVATSEFIVRLGYVVKKLNAGCPLKDAVPNAADPALRRQLLIAHAAAALINAGKVTLTKNPLGISWPLALTLLRYVAPEVSYLLYGQELERQKMIDVEVMDGYRSIHDELDACLRLYPNLVV